MPSPPTSAQPSGQSPNRDLGRSAFLVAASTLLPPVLLAAGLDLVSLYLDVTNLLAVVFVTYTLVAWAALERFNLDRPNLIVASVLVGSATFVAVPLVLALLGGPDWPILDYVSQRRMGSTMQTLLLYTASFPVGSGLAVLCSKGVRDRSAARGSFPDSRTILTTVAALVLVAAVVGAGANHVAARSAAVATVDPGVNHWDEPHLNVTVTGGPAELRVIAVAPDGTDVTRRLSRAAMRDGTETASFRLYQHGTTRSGRSAPAGLLPPQNGTYQVRVKTLSGVTVDTATFTVGAGPQIQVEHVAARPHTATTDSGGANEADTWEGYVITLDVATSDEHQLPFVLTARTVADGRTVGQPDRRTVLPGDHTELAVWLPAEDAREVGAENGGTMTVELVRYDRPIRTIAVRLSDDNESDPGTGN